MMKKIGHVKKFISNKYSFVLGNSTAVIIGVLILIVLSGATYSLVTSGFNNENNPSKTTRLKTLDKTDLNKPTDSTTSKPKDKGTKEHTDNHNVSVEDNKDRRSQKSSSSSSEDTAVSDVNNHPTQPTSSPEKPATCPYHSFDTYLSPLARHNDSDTISYTATYTITPICANFGNPNITITITTGMHYSPCINMADRNNGIISITRRYDGNNTFSITCIVKRVLLTNPSVPHYVAPLPSASRFYLGISATLRDGSIVGGGSNICYLEPGFDRY